MAMQVQTWRQEVERSADTTFSHIYMEEEFAEMYQQALQKFQDKGLFFDATSEPADTVDVEGLTLEDVLSMAWWPDTVR